MLLHGADGGLAHRLDRRHEPYRFSGDLPLDATLLGGPSTDFNVMTRRGRFRAEVTRHGGEVRMPAAALPGLLLCSEGDWQIEGSTSLEVGPLRGVFWREGRPALTVRPLRASPDSCLLLVDLLEETRG
jgi:environmental stress-induced protein Ves